MASPSIALLDKTSGSGTSASFSSATVSGRGQLVVLFIENGHSALNVPANWAPVTGLNGTSVTVGTIYAYWIRRGGSEPSKTWTWTGSVYWEIYPFEYTGIIGGAGTFIEAVSVGTPTTGTSPDPPSITTLSTDTLVNILPFTWAGWGGGFMVPPAGYGSHITGDGGFDVGLAVKAIGSPAFEDPGTVGGASASSNIWAATFVVASQAAGGPTISAQPSDAHVHVGATTSFSVTASASGGGSLSYQWKKNGSNVSGGSGGTSSSYTTPTLGQADDGATYTCDVTETGGSSPGTTVSAAATLRVGVIYVAAGTIAYSAAAGTTVSPGYPAGLAANDKLVMVLGQKPSTANGGTATTPSGWNLDGSRTGGNDGDTGGYTTTLGADTGNCNIYQYSKTATGSESGTLAVTIGTNGVTWAQILCYRAPASATWSVSTTTGKDTAGGNVSITGGADPGVAAGDYALAAMVIPTDVTTPAQFSAEAFSQTGVTFGTVSEISEPDSTTDNDIGGVLFHAPIASGTSSAAPTFTATAGGTTTNVRGPGVFVRLRATASGNNYSLTCAQGTVTTTGQAMSPRYGRKVVLAQGTTTLTGQALNFKRALLATLAQGTVATTGQAVALAHGYKVALVQGTVTTTGQPVGFLRGLRLALAQGAYAQTGQPVALNHGYRVLLAFATIAIVGQAVALRRGVAAALAAGVYSLVGQAMTPRAARRLVAAQGTVTTTGQTVGLLRGLRLLLAQGSVSTAGQAVALRLGKALTLAQGTYALAGQALAARHGYVVPFASGAYATTGYAVDLVAGANRTVAMGLGTFATTGQAMTPRAGRKLVLAQGTVTTTGQVVTLKRGARIVLAPGAYTVAGQLVGVLHGSRVALAQGTYAYAGQAVTLFKSQKLVSLVAGNYATTGQAVGLRHAARLIAAQGSVTTTGRPVSIVRLATAALISGSYATLGQVVALRATRFVQLVRGQYAVTGQDVGIRSGNTLSAQTGSYTTTGNALVVDTTKALVAVSGFYNLVGQSVGLVPTFSFVFASSNETVNFVVPSDTVSFVVPNDTVRF